MITPWSYARTVIHIANTPAHAIVIASRNEEATYHDIAIVVEAGAQVTLYSMHNNAGALFRICSIVLHIGVGAQVTYIDRGEAGNECTVISMYLGAQSLVLYQGFHGVSGTTKTILNLMLVGVGAQGDIRLGSVAQEKGHHSIRSVQYHDASNTTSHCMIRSVVYDEARTTYDGMIHVAKQIRKTVAQQLHTSLLLGERAHATARPYLKVLSHDGMCKHGSAIGQLDMDQLFYLQCHGLSYNDARQLLVDSFLSDLYTKGSMQKS